MWYSVLFISWMFCQRHKKHRRHSSRFQCGSRIGCLRLNSLSQKQNPIARKMRICARGTDETQSCRQRSLALIGYRPSVANTVCGENCVVRSHGFVREIHWNNTESLYYIRRTMYTTTTITNNVELHARCVIETVSLRCTGSATQPWTTGASRRWGRIRRRARCV